jgi:hypothetical protein
MAVLIVRSTTAATAATATLDSGEARLFELPYLGRSQHPRYELDLSWSSGGDRIHRPLLITTRRLYLLTDNVESGTSTAVAGSPDWPCVGTPASRC